MVGVLKFSSSTYIGLCEDEKENILNMADYGTNYPHKIDKIKHADAGVAHNLFDQVVGPLYPILQALKFSQY